MSSMMSAMGRASVSGGSAVMPVVLRKYSNKDASQRSVDAAGNLGHEGVAASEDVTGELDQLVGVRGVRQVVVRENERLREAPRFLLVRDGVLLDLLENLAVGVGRGDLLF